MRRPFITLLVAFVAGCRQGGVKQVDPELGLGQPTIDFGVVKVAATKVVPLEFSARTQASVEGVAASLQGHADFTVGEVPPRIDGLATVPVDLRFAPSAAGPVTATLSVRANDQQRGDQTVSLTGTGAFPSLSLAVACDRPACAATVSSAPPAIDFGEEPLLRRLPLDESQLPSLVVRSTGPVPVRLSAFTITGPAAASYSFAAGAPVDQDLAPAAELRVPLRFIPSVQQPGAFEANVTFLSDVPASPTVTVTLTGRVRPNLPPAICLNLSSVQPPGGAPVQSYDQASDWAPLLTPPALGYDFSASRRVAPRSVVTLSAHAPGGPRSCSADPEDGRLLLTYAWTLLAWPPSAPPPALAGETGPTLRLAPVATGDYRVRLAVRDAQGSETTTEARFRVEVRNELVVQLAWGRADGGPVNAGVDLDLHLVRPGRTPFGVSPSDAGWISDDVSGFTASGSLVNAGLTLDWGLAGPSDDPRLNVDDPGDGPLVENVSLDAPANGCTTSGCRYAIYVHAFRDERTLSAAPRCMVVGCKDGEACGCVGDARCVADAAPRDAGATGAGSCRPSVDAEVRVFVRGATVATLPLPSLMPADALPMAAPCHLLHVADVEWPPTGSDAGVRVVSVGVDGTGRFTMPEVRRFGWRPPGPAPSLTCSPNTRLALPSGMTPWFSEEPR